MAFRHLDTHVKPYTHDLAVEVANYARLGIERDLLAKRQDHLREVILNGVAVPFYIARVKVNGEAIQAPTKGRKGNGNGASAPIWYRANGQHSSDLLARWPENTHEYGAFPEGLVAVVSDFEADTKEDAALLFQQFDPAGSARTRPDLYGAYQGIYPAIADVPRANALLALDGYVWHQKNIDGLPVPERDRIPTWYGEVKIHGYIRWMGTFIFDKAPEMREQPVAAAMYGTFCINEQEADEFWKAVASGGGDHRMEETHPTKKLDDWLLSNTSKQRVLNRVLQKQKPGNYYQGCAFAWNAYRADKAIKSIISDTAKGLFSLD